MTKRKPRYWLWAFVGVTALLLAGFAEFAEARGGRGGGRGGRGGGGMGRRGGGGGRGSNARKEDQQRVRQEQRLARVQQARLEYAKRERQDLWDAEADARMRRYVRRILGGATE